MGDVENRTDGLSLGPRLGLSEGTALAHVSQHIRNTESYPHLVVGSSLAAQSQVS